MKRTSSMSLILLAAAVLVGSPAFGKHTAKHSVSCKQIKDAIAAGKSEDDVEKELKVSASRVKSCTAPPAKHTKHTDKKT